MAELKGSGPVNPATTAAHARELKSRHNTQGRILDGKNVMCWQVESEERGGRAGGWDIAVGCCLLAATEAHSRILSRVPSRVRWDGTC